MNSSSDLISRRIETLPISPAERAEALAYVRAGEELVEVLTAIARLFQLPRALKPSL